MSRSQFKCPFCGQINEGDASLVNTKSQCVSCGNIFLLTPLKNEISKESAKFWFFLYLRMFKQYFRFGGRVSRKDFWTITLFEVAISLVLFIIAVVIEADFDLADFFSNIGYAEYRLLKMFLIASAIPYIALVFRRLHDTDKSGLWIFLLIVPVVHIALIVWLASAGDIGSNRFGLDPTGRDKINN